MVEFFLLAVPGYFIFVYFYLLATFKTFSSDDITIEDVFPICYSFEVSKYI